MDQSGGQVIIVATHIPIVDPGKLYTKVHPYRSYVLAARINRSHTNHV
ncbi:MAG TPA: hypothetical protein VFS96_04880 [Nitrolancea sp.]|nr:hypothetical protein [Nitrolancea sp.]